MAVTLRLLSLLDVLQDRGWVAGPELAARLEVEPRALRRDITRLQELGFPVESRLGREGGYRLRPGYRLPPLMLSDDQATAVALALRAALARGLETSAPAIETALAKVLRVLPATLQRRLRSLEATIDFSGTARQSAPIDADVLLALGDGVDRRRRLRIVYATPGREPRERDIDALGVVVVAGRWYVPAHDHASGEQRVFRVDRIQRAMVLDIPTSGTTDVDPIALVEGALARVPRRWSVEVIAAASLEDVRRAIPASVADLAHGPDGVRIRLGADDIDGAARMLASMPWRFRVIEPPELRVALTDRATRLLEDAAV